MSDEKLDDLELIIYCANSTTQVNKGNAVKCIAVKFQVYHRRLVSTDDSRMRFDEWR